MRDFQSHHSVIRDIAIGDVGAPHPQYLRGSTSQKLLSKTVRSSNQFPKVISTHQRSIVEKTQEKSHLSANWARMKSFCS